MKRTRYNDYVFSGNHGFAANDGTRNDGKAGMTQSNTLLNAKSDCPRSYPWPAVPINGQLVEKLESYFERAEERRQALEAVTM